MSKRIVFPKPIIARAENLDFSDDGTRFRGYMYRNLIPITYTRYDDLVFCSIRLDYLFGWNDYSSLHFNLDKYNGLHSDDFDMNDFINICEQCYQFAKTYNSAEAKKNRILERIAQLDKQIQNLLDTKSTYMAELERIDA